MAETHNEGYPNFFKSTAEWVVGGSIDVNGRADKATFTLATPSGSDRDITVQLNDALGNAVTEPQTVEIHVFADSAGLAWASTGGSTGLTDNGAGSILPLVAKKVFTARSNATGELAVQWTDTASEVAYLGVKLSSGRTVISGAITI